MNPSEAVTRPMLSLCEGVLPDYPPPIISEIISPLFMAGMLEPHGAILNPAKLARMF